MFKVSVMSLIFKNMLYDEIYFGGNLGLDRLFLKVRTSAMLFL